MKQINSQKTQIKLRNKFIKSGVKMIGPETIFFSEDTKIGKNVVINPYVVFGKKVKIGNNVIINSFSHLEDCKVENKVCIGCGRTTQEIAEWFKASDKRKREIVEGLRNRV